MRFQLGFGAILWGVFLVLLHHIIAKTLREEEVQPSGRSVAREFRYKKSQ